MTDSKEVVRKLLDKIAKENKLENYDAKIEPICTDGANFTSHLYSATISNSSVELNLFAKVIVVGEMAQTQGLDTFCKTEPFVYTKLSKFYRQLEENYEVPIVHTLKFPRLYKHISKRGMDIMVIENFSSQGYSVHDRLKPINDSYAFNAIQELAKFHALSFAFKQKYPADFKDTLETLKFEPIMDENFQSIIANTLQRAFSITDERNRQRLQNYFSKLDMEEFLKFMKPLRHPVLIHGDFKMSNIMHKLIDDGKYDMKIVDYQMVQGSSLVIDLLYFIFTGTNEEFRSKYYFPLLDHYYTQLSLAMRRLGLEPSEIYSREDFDYELKQKLPYGLFVALILLPIILVDAEDAPKVDKDSDMSSFEIKNIGKVYPARLNGIVNDFVRWNVL